MPKPTPVEDLLIPPQDNKICGVICLCQLTAVLSSVALVYLSVAVYMPSLRAFNSGVSEVPVMCTTTRAVNRDSCDWGTCGEWCLSKSSGACIQIHVSLRRNGSSLLFANCSHTANKTCYGIDQESAKKSRCIADECKNLTGTFNCTMGTCINITDAFKCEFTETEAPLKCSGRRGKITCIEMDGLQNCHRGMCERIKTPYNCDRRCVDIPTRNKNTILLSGDKVYLSRCQSAQLNDSDSEVWNARQDNILMASCHTITNTSRGVEATDCINGTLLDKSALTDLTNFTYLSHLSVFNPVPLDETRVVAPPEQDLVIANESRLMINLEGCVNTLRDECRDFLRDYGQDGSDHNARARFPCFYAEQSTDMVVARFDLEATYREFLIASLLPSVLFIVSCLTLLLCQRTVEVGDDAKMRFKCCGASLIAKALSKDTLGALDAGGGTDPMAL